MTLARGVSSAITNRSTVLNNCSDADTGHTPAMHSVEPARIGDVVYNATTGTITYTRHSGKFGPDSFNCIITDNHGGYTSLIVKVDQADSDGDGMPDDWEDLYGVNRLSDDHSYDPEGDGLPNVAEYKFCLSSPFGRLCSGT